MPTIKNLKWSCLILHLLVVGGSAFAKNICSGDTGFMVAGSEAATIIKKAILQSCKNDPSEECARKNTNAIDKVQEICSQCDIETSKEYCINAAENAASRALDELIQEKENQDREAASQARWDEAEKARIAEARSAAEKLAKQETERPACAPFCKEKDLAPAPEKLPLDKAEIKGLRINMTAPQALKILNSKNMVLSVEHKNDPSKKIFVCGIKIKSTCDFSIAGEQPFAATLGFFDGALRLVKFVITHPDDVKGKPNIDGTVRAGFVNETYSKILKAFVEKFGMPIQDRPHPGTAPGEKPEIKPYENKNVWIFGAEESIVVNLNKSGLGSFSNQQINIEFFDQKWQIKETKIEQEEKIRKNNEQQTQDLNKRKGDL